MNITYIRSMPMVLLSLVVGGHGRAESIFRPPDPSSLVKSSGFSNSILDSRRGEIRIDCGSGIYEDTDEGRVKVKDYIGLIDIAQCRIIERIPSRIIRLTPEVQEKYKDLLAQDYVENTYYFSRCGCNPTLISWVKHSRDKGYYYSYRIKAGNKRGVSALSLGTNLFEEVIEPTGVSVGKNVSNEKAAKQYYVYEGVHFKEAQTTIMPIVIGESSLLAGREFFTTMASQYPPGVIKVSSSCASWPDDNINLQRLPFQSNICEDILHVFMGEIHSLTIGPRDDLEELLPDELARKLSEEVPKFIEVGWVRPEVARAIQNDLGRIEKARTAVEASRLAGELLDRTSKMQETACSVECRSIIGVNLQIMLQDLEGWKERERRRSAGADK